MSKRGERFSESHWMHFDFVVYIYSSWLPAALYWGAQWGWIQCDNCVSICLPDEYNVSQQSTCVCSASHLQGRSERRHQHTQSSTSQRIPAFFFFFLWYIILLCLTWSPLAVSLLLHSFGSGSYSNPFLHASDRLILSLLSCCSTWQRIMLGTPFAFQVIHNLCTFTGTYKTKQSWRLHCSQTSRKSYFLWLVANIYLLYGL